MSGSGGPGIPPESPRRNRRRVVAAVVVALVVLSGGFLAADRLGADNNEVPVAVTSPDAPPSASEPSASDAPAAEAESPEATGTPGGGQPAEQPEPPVDEVGKADQDLVVAEPVAIDGGSSTTGDVDIRVTAMEAVDGEARGIGEIAGPSVRFTVSIANGGKDALDISSAVITVEAGAEQLPCSELSGPGTAPFPATVKSGETASGTFVFLIPVESRGDVSVYLNYSVDTAVAAFKGSVPS